MKKAGKTRVHVVSAKARRDYTERSGHCTYVSVMRPVLGYACPAWHIN